MRVEFREQEQPVEQPRRSSAPVGREVHQEIDQFGGRDSSSAAQPVVKHEKKEPEVPVEGGSKRKKTRRSRKG